MSCNLHVLILSGLVILYIFQVQFLHLYKSHIMWLFYSSICSSSISSHSSSNHSLYGSTSRFRVGGSNTSPSSPLIGWAGGLSLSGDGSSNILSQASSSTPVDGGSSSSGTDDEVISIPSFSNSGSSRSIHSLLLLCFCRTAGNTELTDSPPTCRAHNRRTGFIAGLAARCTTV